MSIIELGGRHSQLLRCTQWVSILGGKYLGDNQPYSLADLGLGAPILGLQKSTIFYDSEWIHLGPSGDYCNVGGEQARLQDLCS